MAIKITVSNRVKFPVEGSFKNEEGKDELFKFSLVADRLDAETHRDRNKGDIDFVQFMVDVTSDWSDVKDADGKSIEFSEEGLRQLLNLPGIAALTYFTYLRETGAKQKN